jgi:hypothetical protein
MLCVVQPSSSSSSSALRSCFGRCRTSPSKPLPSPSEQQAELVAPVVCVALARRPCVPLSRSCRSRAPLVRAALARSDTAAPVTAVPASVAPDGSSSSPSALARARPRRLLELALGASLAPLSRQLALGAFLAPLSRRAALASPSRRSPRPSSSRPRPLG